MNNRHTAYAIAILLLLLRGTARYGAVTADSHPILPAVNNELLISDYNYPLPEDRIAKFPLERREMSKLLV